MSTPPSREADRARLMTLVPHRAPMLLLDAFVSREAEQVLCRVDIRAGAPFVVGGHLPAVVTLEYMAQCVAVHAGLTRDGEPRVGYLVSVRELDLMVDEFSVGERLWVRVRHVWNNEISASFEAQVERDGEVVARAKLTVFEPPQGAAPP